MGNFRYHIPHIQIIPAKNIIPVLDVESHTKRLMMPSGTVRDSCISKTTSPYFPGAAANIADVVIITVTDVKIS
jgi:hypothetical protein